MEISQIDPMIYLGSGRHVTRNTNEFKNLNIDVVINCCNEITHKNTADYIIEHFPMDDGSDGTLVEFMDAAVDKINYHLNQNRRVYVHCVHGKSRSPAILIYYYMKHHKLNFNEAYKKISSVRPFISINNNFIVELKFYDNWKKLDHNLCSG